MTRSLNANSANVRIPKYDVTRIFIILIREIRLFVSFALNGRLVALLFGSKGI